MNRIERIHTVVIGGGQAGLAVGYHLQKLGVPFVILDANERVGDAWRNRWDSLRLFTPARYAGMPGMPFPLRGDQFPTKEQMADYLVAYAQKFKLPIRNGVRVDGLCHDGLKFLVTAGNQRYVAENVVVAMANYQEPRVPEFARELDSSIVQMHSHDYRNPSQLEAGSVLVVGAGNSGADIAMDIVGKHPVWMAGKESGHIPFPIDNVLGRYLLSRVVRFVGHHVLTVRTPMGRRARPKMLHQTTPLVRVKPQWLVAAGVERVPKVKGVLDGKPVLEDGRVLDAKNVIWCTGYDPGFSWIHLPVLDERGDPMQEEGIVEKMPGLFFVGLHFQYAMSSATVVGVGRDAERIAKAVVMKKAPYEVRAVKSSKAIEALSGSAESRAAG